MGIFGRKKQQPVRDEAPGSLDVASGGEDVAAAPSRGPRDRADVTDRSGRLDLGALWLRGVPGMQLRLEADQQRQQVIGAQLVLADSQMQVQAFAAPRSAGIWDEIREEIAQSLATGGGTAEEVEGPYGPELHVRMPSRAPNGQTVFSPARFVGVDGPRWFFRAVMSGRAAIDDAVAEEFYALIDDVVVVRGEIPMAPREVLTLALPKTAKDAEAAEAGGDAPADSGLDPFERGPEITEIR